MSVLDSYGNPTTSSRKMIASSDKYSQGLQYIPDMCRDLDDLFTASDWRSTLTQSRLIFGNFAVPRAASIQKADWAVGRAWEPEFNGEDMAWANEYALPFLADWYKLGDVRGCNFDFTTNLWLDSLATDRDGDYFILLTENELGYPMTQRIPAHRVGSRGFGQMVTRGKYAGKRIVNGCVKDSYGKTIAFLVLGESEAQDEFVDAANIHQGLDPEWHDQSRGIPAFHAAIPELRKAKTSEEWELMAQLVASSHALIEYNDDGTPDFDAPDVVQSGYGEDDSLTVQTYSGGMVKHYKANSGNKLESLTTARPSDMWDSFQDRVQRSACRGIAWPYELAWKMDHLTGVTVRSVQEQARHSVASRQDILRIAAYRQITYAIAKGIENGFIPAPSNPKDWRAFSFIMPAQLSIDPRNDSKTMIEEYKLGILNMTGITREKGKVYAAHIRERANEVIEMKKIMAEVEAQNPGFTIDPREMIMLTPNEMGETTEEESNENSDI